MELAQQLVVLLRRMGDSLTAKDTTFYFLDADGQDVFIVPLDGAVEFVTDQRHRARIDPEGRAVSVRATRRW